MEGADSSKCGTFYLKSRRARSDRPRDHPLVADAGRKSLAEEPNRRSLWDCESSVGMTDHEGAEGTGWLSHSSLLLARVGTIDQVALVIALSSAGLGIRREIWRPG